MLLVLPVLVHGQDLIFRKDGKVIRAKVRSSTSHYVTYQDADRQDSVVYHTSLDRIDSILYQDGRREQMALFRDPALPRGNGTVGNPWEPTIRHHLLGVNLIGFFYPSLEFSYEFLPWEAHVGFRVSMADNLGYQDYYSPGDFSGDEKIYGNINQETNWHGMAGVNFYLWPQWSFRPSAGLHYCFGKRDQIRTVYSADYDYYNEIREKKKVRGMVWSLSLYNNITKHLAFRLGTDIPLAMNPPIPVVMVRGDFLLNF